MKEIKCNSVRDLLTNDAFINYVLGIDSEESSQWERWIKDNPLKNDIIQQARSVLQSPYDVEIDIEQDEIDEIKSQVISSARGR